jgi:hypothetical protein
VDFPVPGPPFKMIVLLQSENILSKSLTKPQAQFRAAKYEFASLVTVRALIDFDVDFEFLLGI